MESESAEHLQTTNGTEAWLQGLKRSASIVQLRWSGEHHWVLPELIPTGETPAMEKKTKRGIGNVHKADVVCVLCFLFNIP